MANTAYEYLNREQTRMVRFLERNHSLSGFLEALVAHLTNFCEKEHVRPEDIELDMPFVSTDGNIHARIRRR